MTAIRCVAAALLLGIVLPGQDEVVVWRGATLWPGDGPAIEQSVLVTVGGRVQSLGDATTAIPDGARVVDCQGQVITPGLIDAAWNGGSAPADANEQSDEITPTVHVLDNLDPQAPALLRARSSGVTTVHVLPGSRNVMGGLSAIVKTSGQDPRDMVVRDEASLRLVLGAEPAMGNMAIGGGAVESVYFRRPTTRMGVIWAARRAFYDAKEYLARTVGDPAAGGDDPSLAVIARVLQGTLPVLTTARSEQDLRTALRLAEEFGFTPVIEEAQDAWAVADELQKARVWVIVGAPSQDRVGGPAQSDGAEPRYATIGKLRAAGVPFVIATGSNTQALELVREAMFAHRFGLSAQDAIAAVTSQPARLLGIEGRTGTLARGRDADFVVWSANPLDPTALPLHVVVDGQPTDTLR